MASTQTDLIENLHNDLYESMDFVTTKFIAISEEIKSYIFSYQDYKLIDRKAYSNPKNPFETVEDIIIFLRKDISDSVIKEFDDIQQPIIQESHTMAVIFVFEVVDGQVVDTNELSREIKESINDKFSQVIYRDGMGHMDLGHRLPSGVLFYVPMTDISHFEDFINSSGTYICMPRQISMSIAIETCEFEAFNKLIRKEDVRVLTTISPIKHSSKIEIILTIPIDIGVKMYEIMLASLWVEMIYCPPGFIQKVDNNELVNRAKQNGIFIRTALIEKNQSNAIVQLRSDTVLRHSTFRIPVHSFREYKVHSKFWEFVPVIDGYCYITTWQLACITGNKAIIECLDNFGVTPESIDKNLLEKINLFILKAGSLPLTSEFFSAHDSALTHATQQMRLLYLCFGQIFSDVLPPLARTGVLGELLSSIVNDTNLLNSQSSTTPSPL